MCNGWTDCVSQMQPSSSSSILELRPEILKLVSSRLYFVCYERGKLNAMEENMKQEQHLCNITENASSYQVHPISTLLSVTFVHWIPYHCSISLAATGRASKHSLQVMFRFGTGECIGWTQGGEHPALGTMLIPGTSGCASGMPLTSAAPLPPSSLGSAWDEHALQGWVLLSLWACAQLLRAAWAAAEAGAAE